MFLRLDQIAETCENMSRLEAKVILMFALLGAALALRAPSEADAEANGLSAEMEDDESELALQQDTAELMLTYMKMAEEHANVHRIIARVHACSDRNVILLVPFPCMSQIHVYAYIAAAVSSRSHEDGSVLRSLQDRCWLFARYCEE